MDSLVLVVSENMARLEGLNPQAKMDYPWRVNADKDA
jgi:hypothetical protein